MTVPMQNWINWQLDPYVLKIVGAYTDRNAKGSLILEDRYFMFGSTNSNEYLITIYKPSNEYDPINGMATHFIDFFVIGKTEGLEKMADTFKKIYGINFEYDSAERKLRYTGAKPETMIDIAAKVNEGLEIVGYKIAKPKICN